MSTIICQELVRKIEAELFAPSVSSPNVINQVFDQCVQAIPHLCEGTFTGTPQEAGHLIEAIERVMRIRFCKDADVSKVREAMAAHKDKMSVSLLKTLLGRDENFRSCSQQKKAFIHSLQVKNLAGLLGDAYNKEAKDRYGETLENQSLSEAVQFFLTGLEYLQMEFPDSFKTIKEPIATFRHLLQEAGELSAELILAAQNDQLVEKQAFLKDFSLKIQSKIEALPSGDSLLVPWGWAHPCEGGHTLLLLVTKKEQDLFLEVINTGDGLEYHELSPKQTKVGTTYYDAISSHRIDLEQKNEFYAEVLPILFEPLLLGKSEEKNTAYSIEELYQMLLPYRTKAPVSLPKAVQQSGSDNFKGLMAVYEKWTGHAKELKFLWEQKIVEGLLAFRDVFLGVDPYYGVFLSRTLSNLYRGLEKKQKNGWPEESCLTLLDRFDDWQTAIKTLYTPLKDVNPSFQADPGVVWSNQAIAGKIAELQKSTLSSTSQNEHLQFKKLAEGTWHAPIFTQPDPQVALVDFIAAIKQKIQLYQEKWSSHDDDAWRKIEERSILTCGIDTCRRITQVFVEPAYQEMKIALLAQLDTVNLCQEMMHVLTDLVTVCYNEDICKLEPSTFIYLEGIRLALWEVAVKWDDLEGKKDKERLDHYGLSAAELRKLQNLTMSPLTFPSVQVEKDYAAILAAYESRFGNQGNSLFDFNRLLTLDKPGYEGAQAQFVLDPQMPEYRYASANKQFQEADQQAAHAEFDKAIKNFAGNSSASKEDWEIGWAIVHHKLPKPFHNLFFVSELNQRISPLSNVRTSWDKELSLHVDQKAVKIGSRSEFKRMQTYRDWKRMRQLFVPSVKKDWQTPKKIKKMDIGLDLFSSADYPLVHQPQNVMIQHMSSRQHDRYAPSALYSIESIHHPLNLTMLFDYYRTHLSSLEKREERVFFESILHAPFQLLRGLKEHPQLAQDCLHFFAEALTRIQQLKLQLTGKEKWESIEAFLIEQKVRTLVTLTEGGDKRAGEELLRTRESIHELRNNDPMQSICKEILLQMALVETYGTCQPWTSSDCARALKEYHQLRQILHKARVDYVPYSEEMSPFLYLRMQKSLVAHMEEVLAWMMTDACKDWLQAQMPHIQIESYSVESFPILQIHTKPAQEIFFHLLTGECSFSPEDKTCLFSPTGDCKDIFGERKIPAKFITSKSPSRYVIVDSTGDYQILENDWISKTIQKRIEGHWHTYLSPEELMLPEKLSQEWCLWMDKERGGLPLIYDKEGSRLGHIRADGIIHLEGPPPVKRRYAQSVEWNNPLFKESKSAFYVEETDDKGRSTVTYRLPDFLDPLGRVLEFTKMDQKWHWKSDPAYFISESQYLEGFDAASHCLVLENRQKDQIAFIPSPELFERNEQYTHILTAIQLQAHTPILQKSAHLNAWLAGFLMVKAAHPADYQRVMTFLEHAQEFRAYTHNEFLLLHLLADEGMTHKTPEGLAIRLYADYLLHDNLRHFPRETIVSHSHQEKKLQKLIESYQAPVWQSEERKSLLLSYLRNRHNLPYSLRIEQKVAPHELQHWGYFAAQEKKAKRIRLHQNPFSLQRDIPLEEYVKGCRAPSNAAPPRFITRPKERSIALLPHLYALVRSSEPEKRRHLEHFIRRSAYGKRHLALSSFLLAIMDGQNPQNHSSYSKQFVQELDRVLQLDDAQQKAYFREHYPLLERHYRDFVRDWSCRNPAAGYKSESTDLLTESFPGVRTLSKELPKPRVPYQVQIDLYTPFHDIGKRFFKQRPVISSRPAPLFPKIRHEVEWLNQEYTAGYQRNLQKQEVRTYFSFTETQAKLQQEMSQIRGLVEEDSRRMQELAGEIVSLGNSQLRETIRGRTLVGAEKLSLLTLEELLHLLTFNDAKKTQTATLIENPATFKRLIFKVGRYLELGMRKRHAAGILQAIEHALEAKEDDGELKIRLGLLQDLLETPYELVAHPNPLIQLTFQHFMQVNLLPEQVQGLNDMLKRGSHYFLQAPTGTGKTLVWQQLMAYYNADGYGAAVQVSPTHQFASGLYEMADRAKKSLGQKGIPVIFHDTPLYNNEKYLKTLEELILRGIEERAYLHTIPTSLRALRTAYVHARVEAYHHAELDKWQRERLLANADSILRILALLRGRGHLHFEEVDEAQSPKHAYHKGIGSYQTLDDIHLDLMSFMLRLGMQAQTEEGKPLIRLKNNQQTQMTEEEKETLTYLLVSYLVTDTNWLKNFGCEDFTESERQALKAYLADEKAPVPLKIAERIKSFQRQHKEMTTLDHLLLCRQLIAGRWLFTSLSKSVYEHHGITYEKDRLPISIPFIANLKPLKNSEFSDPFRMGLNTFMDYYVQGLTFVQCQELVQMLQERAFKEFDDGIDVNPKFQLFDTYTHRQFTKLLQAKGIEGDLFTLNLQEPRTLANLQEIFHLSHPIAFQMVADYVASKILKHKNLFTDLVACNGMNTATLGAKASGSSATLDSPHIAPMMGVGAKGELATVKLEKGIFGQWVDQLIRKHRDVYIMGDEPSHLFRDVLGQMPLAQRKRFRGIMDGGCHFRGVLNQEVAKLMCEELRKFPEIEVEGVLYFDQDTDLPYFMYKHQPESLRRVHSFRVKHENGEEIFEDLSLPLHKIAVYFNQDKTTSTNIPLMKDAVLISTFTENTSFVKKMQSDGRARKSEFGQSIITALQKGALAPMSEWLRKPALLDLPLGFVEDSNMIRDVILYSFCIRGKKWSKESFWLCMQNMQNTVQRFLLDFELKHPDASESIFTHGSLFFTSRICHDFVRDFGLPKKEESMESYLNHFIEVMRERLEKIGHKAMTKGVLESVVKALNQIKDYSLPAIPKTIKTLEMQTAKAEDFFTLSSRGNVALQIQENQAVKIAECSAINDWKPAREWGSAATRKPLDVEWLYGSDRAKAMPCYSLDEQLAKKFPKTWTAPLFSKRLKATENFVRTVGDKINLGDNLQKPLFHILVIQDTIPKLKTQVVLVSAEDAEDIANHFTKNPHRSLPEGQSRWLLRPSGDLAWPGPSSYDKEAFLNTKSIRKLFVQLHFFAGNLSTLERQLWQQALNKWFFALPSREQAKAFFENTVLRPEQKAEYMLSKTYKLLHQR